MLVIQWWRFFVATWQNVQISRHGMYSIERLQAFQEYYQKVSPVRIALVCFLTPLPPLAAILLIEVMPLRPDDNEEWKRDWGLWTRLTLTAFIITASFAVMVKNKIPELRLSRGKCIVIGAGSAAAYSFAVLFLAYVGIFPIPFLLVVGMIPLIVFSSVILTIIVGRQTFRRNVGLRAQLKWFAKMLLVKTSLLIIYPAYNAIFKTASPFLQNILVVCLIALKIILKNVVSRAAEHLEDYIPIIVILLVDLFNALYLTVSMQSASSTTTGLLIIGSDWVQLLWTLRGIHKRTIAIRELLQLVMSKSTSSMPIKTNFLSIVLRISSRPEQLEVQQLRKIRLRACLDQCVSQEHLVTLQRLESMQVYADGRRKRLEKFVAAEIPRRGRTGTRERGLFSGRRLSQVSVIPIAIGPRQNTIMPTINEIYRSAMRKQSVRTSASRVARQETLPLDESFTMAAANHKTRLLFQTLQMLFHTEYLVLLEYVECAIPLIYVVYFSILKLLPNAAMYPHHGENSSIQNVLLYALLELLSLGIIHAALRRTFQFSPLYQLAFVLEKQVEFVQSKLMLWIIILLQFQLRHYGSDFSFDFEWLRRHTD